MPTIVASEPDLVKLIGSKVDRNKLISLLPLAKAEFDGEEEGQLRIELQDTNRPDLWSAEGIARQLRSYLKNELTSYSFFKSTNGIGGSVEVDPKLKDIRPIVGAFVAKGVKVDEPTLVQIIQTQEKLCDGYGHGRREAAMGVYDGSDIAFPVKYKAYPPDGKSFVPLDFEEEMTLSQILDNHPKGQEYRHLVDGEKLFPVLEDSQGKVLSFPPIINSRILGEVEAGDDNLFVEVTGYNINLVALVLNIMAVNLADRGWKIEPVQTVFPYDTPLGRKVLIPADLFRKIEFTTEEVKSLLGVRLGKEEICKLLTSYGVKAEAENGKISAVCPPYRYDYMHPWDVIEDVAIAYGYENFKVVMPESFTVGGFARETLLVDRARQELVGYGFQEVFSNILMSREETLEKLMLDEPLVEIENYVSERYSVLRQRLLPSLLRVEASSTKAAYPHRIFEAGEIARYDPEQPHGSRTEEHAAALICSGEAGFSEIHSYLDALLYFLSKSYKLQARELPFAIEGRGASVLVEGEELGVIGEIHPEVLTRWQIEVPVAFFELNLSGLVLTTGSQ